MKNLFHSFAQAIGWAARDVGLVTPPQAQAAMLLQAKGLILAQQHPHEDIRNWVPLKETVEKMYEAEGVPEKIFQQTVAQLQAVDTAPYALIPRLPENAPYFKDCLIAIEPALQHHLEPMLAAQAAARTVQGIEKIAQDSRDVATVLANTRALKNDANEPDYVRAGQSLNCLTDVLTAAIRQNPQLAKNPDVQKALMSAEMLASQTFKRAAEAMEKTPGKGAQVAQKMREARAELRSEVGLFSRILATSAHVEKLEKGLEAAVAALPEHATAIRSATQNNTRRISKLEVFGSIVPLWVDRVRPTSAPPPLQR